MSRVLNYDTHGPTQELADMLYPILCYPVSLSQHVLLQNGAR